MCLYDGCVVFVCASGHVSITIVGVCMGVCMFVTVCGCMVIVLCLYVCLAIFVWCLCVFAKCMHVCECV